MNSKEFKRSFISREKFSSRGQIMQKTPRLPDINLSLPNKSGKSGGVGLQRDAISTWDPSWPMHGLFIMASKH